MAEENTQQPTPQVQQPSPEIVSVVANDARSVLEAIGGSLSNETAAELAGLAGAGAKIPEPTPEGGQQKDPFKNESGALPAEETPAATPETAPAATEEAPAATEPEGGAAGEKKDLLGIRKNKAPKEDIKIEKLDDVLSVFSKNLGMDLKEASDLSKVVSQTKEWRQSAEKLKTVQSDYDKLVEGYQSLPAEFHEAVQLLSEGKDFKEAFTAKTGVDLKKDIASVDKKDLVNHYFPGKFTDDDFSQDEPSAALAIAEEAAIKNFNIDKQQFENKRAQEIKRGEDNLKAFNTSVESSVTNLATSFPNADKDGINAVKQVMLGGPKAVIEMLMENGAFKADAAEKLLFLMHGKDIISDYAEIAANERETKVNEEILKISTDKPAPIRNNGTPTQKVEMTPEEKATYESLKRTTELQKKQNSIFG